MGLLHRTLGVALLCLTGGAAALSSPSWGQDAAVCAGTLREHQDWLAVIRQSAARGELRLVRNEAWNIAKSARACRHDLVVLGTSEDELESLVRKAARVKIEGELRDAEKTPNSLDSVINVEFLWRLGNEFGVLSELLQARMRPLLEAHRKAETVRDREFQDRIRGRCQTRDQRAKLPPLRDQEKMGWCYAFAAADLASFHTGTSVSAVDIALLYNRKVHAERTDLPKPGYRIHSETSSRGGAISLALEHATQRGFCREADLPSTDVNSGTESGGLSTSISLLEEAGASHLLSFEGISCILYKNLVQDWFKNLTFQEFRKIAREIDGRPLVERLADNACRNRIQTREAVGGFPTYREYVWPSEREMRERMMAGLQGRLNQDGITGVDVKINGWLLPEFHFKNEHHAMTIVGQALNPRTGKCEFLIRNSWGRSCKFYDPAKVSCDEQGYIHVAQDVLQERIWGLTLEKNPYEK